MSLNLKVDDIYRKIGEFGPYQLLVLLLVGIIALEPCIVGLSFVFYSAVPQFRYNLNFQFKYHNQIMSIFFGL
jgi:hypothetical protein